MHVFYFLVLLDTDSVIKVPKVFGEWGNEGECKASGAVATCGPGTQLQKRSCTDGTVETCTAEDKHRTVTCKDADSELPKCPGKSAIVTKSRLLKIQ